jgi:hypothetical protein
MAAPCTACGLADRFGHRRMRVDRANQLFDRRFQAQCRRRFGHQLRRAPPDHVHAKQLIVLLLRDDLDEPLGLTRDLRASEHAKRERAGADFVASIHRFPFRQSHAANLGIAVGARRHLVIVDGPGVEPGQALGERNPFGG